MSEIRSVADRHPRLFDAVVAGLLVVACAVVRTGRTGAQVSDSELVDWVSIVVLPVPLIWRRQAPVLSFWAVVALLALFDRLGAESPLSPLVPLVALHAIARYRRLRHVWPALGALALTGVAAWAGGEATLTGVVAVGAIVVATVLLGTNQRTWRAYLAELEQRTARLERERDQQAALAVAAERTRIAREMHDIVAHHLTVMVALANGAAATVASAPQRSVGVMEQVAATGRQALGEMRRLIGVLRVDGRTPQPGLDDVAELVEQVQAAGVRVSVRRCGAPGAWGPAAGLAVYRIVQEALTNTLKHADPHASVEVSLRFGPDRAEIEVVDDGGGRVVADPGTGHGLAGMRERAAPFAGEVDAGPRPGGGWRVRAVLRFADGAAAP